MIHANSLSQTVDDINAALFEQRKIAGGEKKTVAEWITERQGLRGAYSGTYAGYSVELAEGILLFTGERITSASARHILGEETMRVLRLMNVRDASIRAGLKRADEGMIDAIRRSDADSRNTNIGWFCCGKCSVGMWRNLLSGGLERQEERLRKGVGEVLRSHRQGDGRWHRFPFWYTVLALSEVDYPEGRDELRYAAPVLERAAGRVEPKDLYGRRRHALAARALQIV